MNLTKRQEKTMREMCIEQRSNMEIALELGIPVTAVYAWRSRNKLTRKHVEDLLATRLSDSLPLPAVSVPELTAADVNVDARKYRDWCLKVCKVCGVEIAPRKTYCAECASARKRQSQQQHREREKALKPTVAPRGAAALAICNEDCFNCPWDDCRVSGTTPGTGHIDSQISRLNRGITLADVIYHGGLNE